MSSTNPTPTQPKTLEPNVHALTVLVCQDCIDLKGEMCNNPQCVFCRRTMSEVQRYLDVMLLCPIVDGKRLILVGDAVTDEDASRRAAVAGPRNEELRSVCCNAPTRTANTDYNVCTACKEACDTITVAATSSPTPADPGDVGPSDDYVRGWQEALSAVRTLGVDAVYDGENVNKSDEALSIDEAVAFIRQHDAPAERTQVAGETAFFWCPACQQKRLGEVEEITIMCLTCKNVCDVPPGLEVNPSTISDSARRAAEEILEWLNFDTSLDAVQADVYGVWAIISKNFAVAPAQKSPIERQEWRQGMRDAAKEVCDACADEYRYGQARKIDGSTRWWHGEHADFQCEAGSIWHALEASAAAPADNEAESVALTIPTCGDCPFVDHSGAFTPGGAKDICGHKDAADYFAPFVGPGNELEHYHWKRRIVNRNAAPPPQCPLRATTTKGDRRCY